MGSGGLRGSADVFALILRLALLASAYLVAVMAAVWLAAALAGRQP